MRPQWTTETPKGFGRRPLRARGAVVRKPRKEETAGRRGAVWLGATSGDFRVADVRRSRGFGAGGARCSGLKRRRRALSIASIRTADDARAICEAASRPDMRFVRVKSEERQAALMLHTSGHLLRRQHGVYKFLLDLTDGVGWPFEVMARLIARPR